MKGTAGSDCMWVGYVHFGSGEPVPALADGLDITLAVTTGGDGDWTWSNYPMPYYSGDATRSAVVSDLEGSIMETTGYGPGTVSFYWRILVGAGVRLAGVLRRGRDAGWHT